MVNVICKFQYNFNIIKLLIFTNVLIRISTLVNVDTAVTLM
jgi:hypothetical protein